MERGAGYGYSDIHTNTALKELAMNIAKNMEAVFVVAIALAAATSFATAAVPSHQPHGSTAAAPFVGKMQVVTIIGKRLARAH